MPVRETIDTQDGERTQSKISLGNFSGRTNYIVNLKECGHIGGGYYGDTSIVEGELTLGENKRKIQLVRKRIKEKLMQETNNEKQIKIHSRLKQAGIKTFSTYRTDGRDYYSSPLNKGGKIALSSNNPPPYYHGEFSIFNLFNRNRQKYYSNSLKSKLTINNLEELVNSIIIQANKAYNNSITLHFDSIFYIIPSCTKEKEINIEIIVGDLDNVGIHKDINLMDYNSTINNLWFSLESFLKKYGCKKELNEYLSIINDGFQPDRWKNELMETT